MSRQSTGWMITAIIFTGTALFHLDNASQAEDLAQETPVAALEGLDRYAGRASEKTWLTGILRHKILDHFRYANRESVTDDIKLWSEELEDAAYQSDERLTPDAVERIRKALN